MHTFYFSQLDYLKIAKLVLFLKFISFDSLKSLIAIGTSLVKNSLKIKWVKLLSSKIEIKILIELHEGY